MPFAHLKPETITALKQAFAEATMSYDEDLRSLLRARINHQYFDGLATHDSPGMQLAADLNALNSVARLTDTSVPLKIWLENATEQFGSREQAKTFKDALAEMAKGPHDSGATTGPAGATDTEVIVEGLEALSVLIKKNQVAYDAVIIYRQAFQTALYEIEVIGDYKSLHEELHGLQLAWLGPEDFGPMDKLTSDRKNRIRLLSSNVKRVFTKLRSIYSAERVDREEKDWIEQFDQEQKKLNDAINTNAGTVIESCLENIKRELDLRLSALNTRLKKAIDTLQLKGLIKAMTGVCEAIRKIAAQRATEQLNKLEAGTKELTTLDGALSQLIKQHDAWQTADNRLRVLGEMVRQNSDPGTERTAVLEEIKLANLNFALSVIVGSMLPLLERGQASDWSGPMKTSAEEMKAALEAKDSDSAEISFYTYCIQASQYFYDLDGQMKDQSAELKKVGEELRNVNNDLG